MSAAPLLWGVLFSSIGLGYFVYGRKQRAPVAWACGLLLMAYPYFFDSSAAIVAVGLALMAVPRFVHV